MSAASSSRPAAPSAKESLWRIARLTRKELRETLRDRRTIVTLVLMPLLVYPLLSLAFKQFVLSNLHDTGQVEWRIAVPTEQQGQAFVAMVRQGDQLLRADAAEQDSAPKMSLFVYPYDDLTEAVVRSEFDLGVLAHPRTGVLPEAVLPSGAPAAYDFELIYRPAAPIGAALGTYIENRLRAVNQQYVQSRLKELGDSGEMPATWQVQPIETLQQSGLQLATLVPMILILLTIVGAVYPAIDLTAGERERNTLEALMAAPVPRLGLLFAKYLAVLSVAMLTALVNLVGMTVTLLSTGLGPQLFGEGLSLGAVVIVFALLVLFAAFFSALLLCVTSFARSFKEAQAYLIPLMMVSLAPGFLSVMPGLELNAWLSVAPLINIVLLARDVLAGNAEPVWAFVAVITTCLYATAALGLAARIFGSDSILYGSQNSWSDLFRRPAKPLSQPTLGGAMACLACIVPLYVVLSGFQAQLAGQSMATQLAAGAGMLALLFGVLPALVARWQGVELRAGFQLHGASPLAILGAVVLGCSLAPLAYELIVISQSLGIATLSEELLAEKMPLVNRLVEQWRQLSPAAVLLAIAIVPAIAEELFFRGYLLGSMRGRLPAGLAIAFAALAFGLFHASVGGIIAVERVLSSMSLGLVLGWVCWTTRSAIPGMILHALNNAFVVSLAYWGDGFKGLGWDVEGQRHLPATWLALAGAVALVGLALVYLGRRRRLNPPLPAAPLAAETPPP
ncbi:MAG: ABC transporter permease subunit/CPBP intramembrane protease [Pirellulaceae bacterium]